jgi:hypothetical protein
LADPKKNPAARPATLPKIDKASLQTAAANWRKFCESTAAALSQAPVTESSVALPPETRKGTAMAMVYERHTYPREHLQWTFKAVASKISEYHLIDLATGVSHGGFEALSGARQFAHEKRLPAWDIFHGNLRVEYHDPR